MDAAQNMEVPLTHAAPLDLSTLVLAAGNLDGPAGIAKLEAPVLAMALQLAKMAMSRVTTDTDADSVIYKSLAAQQNGNYCLRPTCPIT